MVESLSYSYDALNRPTTRNADSFGYNDRSEVTSATISGIASAYGYDEIGNSTSYTPNSLNQYTEFTYDADGNILTDGYNSFTYDAANRLKTVSRNGYIVMTNFYDAKSRRVRKVTPEYATTFFYDDWNLIEERIAYTNGTYSTISYYWGKDLSGTLQGAGGVGGLLYLTANDTIYIPCYDNNGNITRYLDSTGDTVAQYTYDAFGNIIAQSGPLADFFRHRFSTKYFDAETGLYYYGYRFYHPTLMRWLNRDPMEESGGVNLYLTCNNNLICSYDLIGLWSSTWASRGEKRRVYKKGNGDTIKDLAEELGMDEKTFHLWARIETGEKALEDKPGRSAPNSDDGLKDVCYISVPNIWVEADCLRGGGVYDHVIVNHGGTIGSFFGQTLGRWGYHTLKPGTPSDLLKTVQDNCKDIYGLTVYAHGTTNGYYIVAPDRKDSIDQLSLMRKLRSNGYRIAAANMMQCYSINPNGSVPIWPKDNREFNYKKAWGKTAVKVYGYEGVNFIGIDF